MKRNQSRTWNKSQEATFIKMKREKASAAEIRRVLNKTPEQLRERWEMLKDSVHAKPKKKKRPKPPKPKKPRPRLMPDRLVPEVRSLMRVMTDLELAAKYAVSIDTVKDFRRRHGLKKPMGRKKGNPKWGVRGVVQAPELPYTTYEENGVTIKRYPAGYARGVYPTRSLGFKSYVE